MNSASLIVLAIIGVAIWWLVRTCKRPHTIPIIPIIPVPVPTPPAPVPIPPAQPLVPLTSIGAATNACGNMTFYGSNTRELHSITASLSYGQETGIGPTGVFMKPFYFDPKTNGKGWYVPWSIALKPGVPICVDIVITGKDGTFQTIKQCFSMNQCPTGVQAIWGYNPF